jgi:capsular exopolysaccharide synthesis family protein
LGEGKTFIGKQLARAFAAAGKNVVLVDADLRKVEHSHDKDADSPGLSDAIMGTVDLMAVTYKTKTDRFWMLPSGPLPPNPSELLDSESMQSILDSLQTGFDVVIVDSSPIRMFSDPLVLASKVDGTILVAEARSTSGESLKAAAELLRGPNINLLGTVLNKVKLSKRHRDHYYYYTSTRRTKPQ